MRDRRTASVDLLQPPPPTSIADHCSCAQPTALKLMPALTYNPFHCMVCNAEVNPDRLRIEKLNLEEIVAWRAVYEGIHRLWLDSKEYEPWAVQELSQLQSAINARGYRLAREANDVTRCYYWLFRDETSNVAAPSHCPRCNGDLAVYPESAVRQLVCEGCFLVLPG